MMINRIDRILSCIRLTWQGTSEGEEHLEYLHHSGLITVDAIRKKIHTGLKNISELLHN